MKIDLLPTKLRIRFYNIAQIMVHCFHYIILQNGEKCKPLLNILKNIGKLISQYTVFQVLI